MGAGLGARTGGGGPGHSPQWPSPPAHPEPGEKDGRGLQDAHLVLPPGDAGKLQAAPSSTLTTKPQVFFAPDGYQFAA